MKADAYLRQLQFDYGSQTRTDQLAARAHAELGMVPLGPMKIRQISLGGTEL